MVFMCRTLTKIPGRSELTVLKDIQGLPYHGLSRSSWIMLTPDSIPTSAAFITHFPLFQTNNSSLRSTTFLPKHYSFISHHRSHLTIPLQTRNVIIPTTFQKPHHFPPLLTLTRLAVLVSGSGRSLENILNHIATCKLTNVQVCVVISSKSTAGAIKKAQKYNIPTCILFKKDFSTTELYSNAISHVCDEYKVDLIVLAGWIYFYRIPERYISKVLNIHPSLIPAFCGKGFYGNRVHQAVVDFGCKVTGCTVHFADNKYDHGPIVLQRTVPVLEGDDAETLAARVFEEEKKALPRAIQLFANGQLRLEGRIVRVLDAAAVKP